MAKIPTTENETSSSLEPKIVSKTAKRQHNLKFGVASEQDYEVIQFDDPQIVREIENQYPEMTMEFKRILFDCYELFCKKQNSYGSSNISLGTDLTKEEDVDIHIKEETSGDYLSDNENIYDTDSYDNIDKIDIEEFKLEEPDL